MARAKPKGKKLPPQKMPLLVRTIALTQPDQDTLDQLSRDASDFLGLTVSGKGTERMETRGKALAVQTRHSV
jgi:hypothetical protein